jgi:hypothetical protein
MKKVISFSLWGNNPTYNIGAIKNAEIAKDAYPDFECWFYIHKDTVPQEIIDTLDSFTNTKIIFKTGDVNNENCKPRMWRYEPIDDLEVELVLSRDTDTRILLREKLAVDEWVQSNKLFHIMRDHPHHDFCILAGMFGTRKIPQIPNWTNIINSYNKTDNRMYDQDFLRDIIYPLIKNNSMVHATFHKHEPHAKNFPINYDKHFTFVGEYVYFDNSRSIQHINELIKHIKK